MSIDSGVDADDFFEKGFNLDDPQYIKEKELKVSVLSQNITDEPIAFRLQDWIRDDPSEHDFSKLSIQIKYMCSKMNDHKIEYDVWVDMLLEWGKNIKHLGKGMNVAIKDFEWRAQTLNSNRDLLLKHGIITKDSD